MFKRGGSPDLTAPVAFFVLGSNSVKHLFLQEQ